MNALIGSGFFAANPDDWDRRFGFYFDYWAPRIAGRDVVIVDNTEPPTEKLMPIHPHLRVIPVLQNLGHIGNLLGKSIPKFSGWSMSWILPALIAYCEGRDVIYIEQDCLVFGYWEAQIYADMEAKNLKMAFGEGSSDACIEQSLFIIKHDFILDAVTLYLAIEEADGVLLTEDKFLRMSVEVPQHIGKHSLGVGRSRPINFEAKTFYAQHISPEELEQLKTRKLI